MNFPEVLLRIAARLDQADIPYMLSGSFASAYYGSLRSTQDIDLVIAATASQLQAFIEGLTRAEYYAELGAALEAKKQQSLFNIIDLKTGWKIDMIICKSRPFSQEEFSRRQVITTEETSLSVASPEDIILSKLEWAKLGRSRRQIEDVAGILKMRAASLDHAYLDKWIQDLGVNTEWNAAQRIAGISDRGDPGQDE